MADQPRERTDEDRPGHPMGASIILVTVVVLLIIALSVASGLR